jgi:hypothetical protein
MIDVQFMEALQEPRVIRSCRNHVCTVSFHLATVPGFRALQKIHGVALLLFSRPASARIGPKGSPQVCPPGLRHTSLRYAESRAVVS